MMNIQVPSWSTTELDIMRIALGFVAIKSFSGIQTFRPNGDLPYPMGIARVIDLRWAGFRSAARWMQYGAYAAALIYAAGLLVPIALAYLMAAIVIEISFRSSFGSVNHGHHLLAVVLTAQTAATVVWNAADHWSWDLGARLADSQQTTAAWWSVQAIVAVYFTSGLSKLINTGGRWIARSPMLLLVTYERLDTDRMMGDRSWGQSGGSTTLVSWLFERPAITQCIFAGGLLVELAAPLGLLGETLLLFMGLALIALHKSNRLLLGLPFPEFQLLVLIYLINVPQIFR
jgi:hypothetical protein